jgi:hypothetical protein
MIYIDHMYFCTQNQRDSAQELHNLSLLHLRTAHEDDRIERMERMEILKSVKEEMDMEMTD